MPEDPGLFATLYTSRALRRFEPDPVPDHVLFQILDAAVRAPSGQNAQDWRFVIVTDPGAKARMQDWASEAWMGYGTRLARDRDIGDLPRMQRLSLRSVEHLAHNLATVPVVIVVCGLRGRHFNPGGSHYPAVQNMLLAARGLGLGGSIFNLPLTHEAELRELLGIPESNEIYCLVPLGYPTDRHGPVQRKPVAKVAFAERWDQPWRFAQDQPDDGWTARWLKEDM